MPGSSETSSRFRTCRGAFVLGLSLLSFLLATVSPSGARPGAPVRAEADDLVPVTVEGHLPLFVETVAPHSVAALVQELGGRVDHVFENIDALTVRLPAESLDRFMADTRVTSAARQRLVQRAIEPFAMPDALVKSGLARRLPAGMREGEEVAPLPEAATPREIRPLSIEALRAEALARRAGDEDDRASLIVYDPMMRVSEVWEDADFGEDVVVAVIDTGIYADHPLIQGNTVGGLNLVPEEEERAIDINFDGVPEGLAFDWDALENDDHGTLIAGVIAGHAELMSIETDPFVQSVMANLPESVALDGDGGASIRLTGMAPAAKLYGVKVFPWDGSGAPDARVAEAIDHLISLKRSGELDVDVVNMSLSGPVLNDGRNPLDKIVDVATREGITMVPAAANDGPSLISVGSPASARTSLAVGAAADPIHTRIAVELFFAGPGQGRAIFPNENLMMADFSSRGRTADKRIKPDILATGFFVFTSSLFDLNQDGINDAPGFGFASGTSLAAPFVSGAAALAIAYANEHNSRAARAPYVARALKRSAEPIASYRRLSSWDQGHGYVTMPETLDRLRDGRPSEPNLSSRNRMDEDVKFRRGHAAGTTPMLEAGETYNFFLEVPKHTTQLRFNFPSLRQDGEPNPFIGDGLQISVHTSKRGGTGDYRVPPPGEGEPFPGPIEVGDELIIPFPEPGEMRVTFGGFIANTGRVGGNFEVEATRDRDPFPVDERFRGKLRRDEMDRHEVEVPEGTDVLVMRLDWKRDWDRFPTYDLDLFAQTPDDQLNFAGATLDAPELVFIENPTPGMWGLAVLDASTVRKKEKYELEISFLTLPDDGDGDGHRLDGDAGVRFDRPRVSSISPNPSIGVTQIGFAIPREERVSLHVFDVAGRLVKTLVNEALPAGTHQIQWDGRNNGGSQVATGVYFVRLDTSLGKSTRKLVRRK